jgi:AraC-like DNA-binding protein
VAWCDGRDELHRKELNTAALCRRFDGSRRRLYGLFKEYGGVEACLRQGRLARCYLELAAADPGRGRVKEVAERWGFVDPSHFHRLFKQHVDVSPSEVLVASPAHHAHRGPACPAKFGRTSNDISLPMAKLKLSSDDVRSGR